MLKYHFTSKEDNPVELYNEMFVRVLVWDMKTHRGRTWKLWEGCSLERICLSWRIKHLLHNDLMREGFSKDVQTEFSFRPFNKVTCFWLELKFRKNSLCSLSVNDRGVSSETGEEMISPRDSLNFSHNCMNIYNIFLHSHFAEPHRSRLSYCSLTVHLFPYTPGH